MMKKLIVALSLVLAACTTPPKPSEELPKQDPLVVLNCPDLPEFDSTQEINMGDLILIIVENANQYYLCKASALKTQQKPSEN